MIKKHTTWFVVLFLCLSWQVHGQTVDLKKGLVTYYPFNGNANDESGNGNHGTVKGAVLTEGLGGETDGAYRFGKTDSIVGKKKLNGMQSSTYSFWFKGNAKDQHAERVRVITTSSFGVLLQNRGNSSHPFYGHRIYVTIPEDRNATKNSRRLYEKFFTPKFKNTEWNHIVVRIDSNDNCFLTMNGEDIELLSTNIDYPDSEPDMTKLGFFTGALDNVRIYNRKITDKEVAAIHELDKAPKTPSITEGLIAYYPFNGNANDESGNGNHGTVNGAKLAEDRRGEHSKAYKFDGNDYIRVKYSNALNAGNNFTMSVWYTVEGASGNDYGTIIGNNNRSSGWWLSTERSGNTTNKIRWEHDTVGGMSKNITFKYSTKIWHHSVIVYNNRNASFYLDNKLIAEKKFTDRPGNSSNDLLIGQQLAGISGRGWKGKIDDIRIYNRALSESEVKMLHDSEKALPKIEQPVISAISQNAVADEGETIEFTVTAEGDKPLKYEWKKLGSNTVLSNMGSLVLKKVDEEDAGSYYVIVSNEGGEAISPVITLGIRPDTDNDGLLDYVEEKLGTSITKRDTDDDGISDYDEVEIFSTAPTRADTDGDGLDDGLEIRGKFNPRKPTERADGSIAIGVAVELEFFTLTWNRYQLQWSKDLERWKDLGDSFQGVGGYSSILQPARKTKVYWRLKIIE